MADNRPFVRVSADGLRPAALDRGFNHDPTPRDAPTIAKLAWQRTLGFLDYTLRA